MTKMPHEDITELQVDVEDHEAGDDDADRTADSEKKSIFSF